MTNNIYGIQKTKETEVRDGWDIASTTTGAAAQGAKIGSRFGLVGAAVGAVGGGLLGYWGGKDQQLQESLQKDNDIRHNSFVSSLEDRSLRTNNYVPIQARYGLNNNRYKIGEIEGDNNKKGIGEIHTDKNFNIKNIASGSPKHENGGVKVVMEEGDIVFPTQNNEKDFKKIMGAIKKYKINGDKSAKKYLDNQREKLPEDTDYKYVTGVKDAKINPGPYTDETWDLMRSNSSMFETFPKKETEQRIALSKTDFNLESAPVLKRKGDPYQYKYNPNTGEVHTKAPNSDKWDNVAEQEKNKVTNRNAGNKDKYGEDGKYVSNDLVRKRLEQDGLIEPYTLTNNQISESDKSPDEVSAQNLRTSPGNSQRSDKSNTGNNSDNGVNNQGQVDSGPISPEDYYSRYDKEGPKYTFEELSKTEDYNNPLKRASIINNLIQGNKQDERVVRRYFQPELYDYNDRSYAQRNAMLEQRNVANSMLRGKGLSIGQQQGYLGQVGARYLSGMEQINEREAQRADNIDIQNTQSINAAKLGNLNLANQYDDLDARNAAVRQAYKDTAMSETASLAMYDEQADYMKARNRKQYSMEGLKLGLLNKMNPNYYYEEDLTDPKFRRDAN